MRDEPNPIGYEESDGLDERMNDVCFVGNVDRVWLCCSTKQPVEADLVQVASAKRAARLQAPQLQQDEVNSTQDMGCSSDHDDGRCRP